MRSDIESLLTRKAKTVWETVLEPFVVFQEPANWNIQMVYCSSKEQVRILTGSVHLVVILFQQRSHKITGKVLRKCLDTFSPRARTRGFIKMTSFLLVILIKKKQTALLLSPCPRRRYVFAMPNAKTIEPGSQVLMSVSEFVTCEDTGFYDVRASWKTCPAAGFSCFVWQKNWDVYVTIWKDIKISPRFYKTAGGPLKRRIHAVMVPSHRKHHQKEPGGRPHYDSGVTFHLLIQSL